ncbi:MAG: NUDIX hydrolase [Oscillospiraceae bacterium]|nr:NUDIX hydrolase [Oscillospiraceae bacterium]
MAEYQDILDDNRIPTGGLYLRGSALSEGVHFPAVNVWVIREDGRFLLTKRDARKPWGLYWECTGGAVQAGEDTVLSSVREVKEETGIDVSGLHPILIDSKKQKHAYLDIYAYFVKGSPEVILQEGETVDYRWVTTDEYYAMKEEGILVPDYAFPMIEQLLKRGWDDPGHAVDHTKRDYYTAPRILAGENDEGAFRTAVCCFVRRPDGRFLITRRAPEKADCAGLWECTSGGVDMGEDSLSAAIREVREETGIDVSACRPHYMGSDITEKILFDNWLFYLPDDPEITLQKGETDAYRWVTAEEVYGLADAGLTVPDLKRCFTRAALSAELWKGSIDI